MRAEVAITLNLALNLTEAVLGSQAARETRKVVEWFQDADAGRDLRDALYQKKSKSDSDRKSKSVCPGNLKLI